MAEREKGEKSEYLEVLSVDSVRCHMSACLLDPLHVGIV